MEPDYNNNYHNSYQSEFKPNGFDDLHLDDEVYCTLCYRNNARGSAWI